MDQVGYLLKRAQQDLRLRLDEALATTGLTMSRYATLALLADAGTEGLGNAELADAAFVSPQTMSRLLSDLAAAGMVERRPDARDRRGVRVLVTTNGREAMEIGHAAVTAVHEQMLADLDDDEQATLHALLRRLVATLDQGSHDAP